MLFVYSSVRNENKTVLTLWLVKGVRVSKGGSHLLCVQSEDVVIGRSKMYSVKLQTCLVTYNSFVYLKMVHIGFC